MIQPLGSRVLLKLIKSQEKSATGLILPNQKIEEKFQVVKLGDLSPEYFSVKEGDFVLTDKYKTGEITVKGETFYVVKEEDIAVILKD